MGNSGQQASQMQQNSSQIQWLEPPQMQQQPPPRPSMQMAGNYNAQQSFVQYQQQPAVVMTQQTRLVGYEPKYDYVDVPVQGQSYGAGYGTSYAQGASYVQGSSYAQGPVAGAQYYQQGMASGSSYGTRSMYGSGGQTYVVESGQGSPQFSQGYVQGGGGQYVQGGGAQYAQGGGAQYSQSYLQGSGAQYAQGQYRQNADAKKRDGGFLGGIF